MTGHQVVANGSTDGSTDGPGIADREVVVACEDVARTYGTGPAAVVAVHGATCRVLAGDRIAISGPSGSGKSTLLHLLAGLEQPTGGTVRRPGRAPGPPAGQIGVVFQGPSLVPALDVTENTALPLVLAGVPEPEARRRAEAALELVGAASLAAKLPEELSGGQAQRAAVARVLALRPRLILADEPTGQLDRATGQHIIDVLLTTADEIGAALVVTTHDQSVAQRLSRRWEMHEGRLLPAPKPKDRPTGVSGGPTGPVHRPPREASRPSQRADQADGPVPEPPRPATDPNHPAGQAAPPAPATEPGPPVTPPVAPPVTPPDPPAAGARQGEER